MREAPIAAHAVACVCGCGAVLFRNVRVSLPSLHVLADTPNLARDMLAACTAALALEATLNGQKQGKPRAAAASADTKAPAAFSAKYKPAPAAGSAVSAMDEALLSLITSAAVATAGPSAVDSGLAAALGAADLAARRQATVSAAHDSLATLYTAMDPEQRKEHAGTMVGAFQAAAAAAAAASAAAVAPVPAWAPCLSSPPPPATGRARAGPAPPSPT